MAKEVRLPQLGQTMEEGTIISCMVKVGDEVKKGDVIFEIETDKATLEMESPLDGFVKHILAEAGQTLPVGAPILVLGNKDEEVPQSFVDSLKGDEPVRAAGAATLTVEPTQLQTQQIKPADKVKASPRARKLAEQLGVDLSKVTGTGPGGRITEQDVENRGQKTEDRGQRTSEVEAVGEGKLGETIPVNRLQKITAQKMLQSKREIPCFYLTVNADVTELVKLRNKLNKTSDFHPVRNSIGNNMIQKGKISNGVKVAYNDFITKAVAIGLEKFPIMTGQLAGDTIQLAESINIGLAIAVPGGLVAPIVKDVNKKDVFQIARDSKELIEKARSNKLAPTDLEGGCITVSNLGSFGIESFIPIVVPGQCSILGIGRIIDTCVPASSCRKTGAGTCVPDDGSPGSTGPGFAEASTPRPSGFIVRKLMSMTLSIDHKVTNGAYAAQFLDFVRKLLEDASTFE